LSAAVLSPTALKWLRQCRVEALALPGLTWAKLLAPGKRGNWWLPTAAEQMEGALPGGGGLAAGAGAAGLPGAGAELLRLAAAQRMNTDVRRAVFCAIMGSEDCLEAFERLSRLPLRGEQDREVIRVLLHCCLAEGAWNPYYGHLALKLLEHSKGHRVTLQFALWDRLKELDGLEPRALTNLARFAALMVAKVALPLSLLKVFEFDGAMSGRAVFFFRLFFQHMLGGCKDDETAALQARERPRTRARRAAAASTPLRRRCCASALPPANPLLPRRSPPRSSAA
jgi:nucleolar MIF4G domain-containing protein 1